MNHDDHTPPAPTNGEQSRSSTSPGSMCVFCAGSGLNDLKRFPRAKLKCQHCLGTGREVRHRYDNPTNYARCMMIGTPT
jgi:hypothetical protein